MQFNFFYLNKDVCEKTEKIQKKKKEKLLLPKSIIQFFRSVYFTYHYFTKPLKKVCLDNITSF